MATPYFTRATLQFLSELALHNDRPWFAQHKADYEALVREPALGLVRDFAPRLARISPHFVAADRKVGGSLMRVQRDVRFAADKAPYKTNIGIQFRHAAGKDVHAPGFYLHVEPGRCFLGSGLWHPDPVALARIRARLVAQPKPWRAALRRSSFTERFVLAGESLKRPPRGFDPDHPLSEDLRRTDHIATQALRDRDVLAPELPELLAQSFAASRPYVAYLCAALDLPC